jgi:hypothetical protein
MIKSFIKFTSKADLDIKNAKFIIYLLEAFVYILQYDNGIIFFLDCGLVRRLNELLQLTGSNFIEHYGKKVNKL